MNLNDEACQLCRSSDLLATRLVILNVKASQLCTRSDLLATRSVSRLEEGEFRGLHSYPALLTTLNESYDIYLQPRAPTPQVFQRGAQLVQLRFRGHEHAIQLHVPSLRLIQPIYRQPQPRTVLLL